MSEIYNNTRLLSLYKVLLENNCSFVAYRLPQKQEVMTMLTYNSIPKKIPDFEIPNNISGFVFAPFDAGEKECTSLFVPDFIATHDKFDESIFEKITPNEKKIFNQSADYITSTYEEYTNLVDAAVEQLKQGRLTKVVLSKIRKEKMSEDFDVGANFLALCSAYPNAMVYLAYLPEVGCWMGATPEQLVISKKDIFETVSLAGTQVATEKKLNEYIWQNKEIEEQGIVTDFIKESIRKIEPENLEISGPENYKAGNLIHLRTLFRFKMNNRRYLNELLKLLHPTPSVGGLPKKAAFDFIKNNENYSRTYYTGFLGPVNVHNETQLFVNLRCVQLFEKDFVLYSGAGITSSSVSANEWVETENKMLTMLKVLKPNK